MVRFGGGKIPAERTISKLEKPNHGALEAEVVWRNYSTVVKLRLTGVEPSGIPSHQYNSKLGL